MRVNELAKELGKTSKEVLDILQRQNQDVKSHSSNISEEQIQMVKRAASGKTGVVKPEGVLPDGASSGAAKPEGAPAPKKKIAAVYRPQNSQQRPARPKSQARDTGRAAGKSQGSARMPGVVSPQGQRDATARPQAATGQVPAEAKPQTGANQAQAPGKTQAASQVQAVRPQAAAPQAAKPQAAPQAVVKPQPAQPQNPARPRDTAAEDTGASRNQGQPYREGRPQAPGSDPSYRDGGRNQSAGRDGGRNQGTGRDGARSQGSRDNIRNQGGRDGARGQGGQGYRNRDGARGQGGFSGGRGGAPRPGQRDSGARSFDTSIQAKPSSNRQNKNNHKNDRYDKKNVNEDGPRSKGGKVSKHPFVMPQKVSQKQVEEVVKVITLPEVLTIRELAEKMKLQPSAIVKKLFLKGQIVTLNSEIDFEKAEEIAMDYDVLCEKEEKVDVIAELLKEDEENVEDMVVRPPVVCVMGHVDHGKTSLLDAIRSTNVTSREAGGITQHIGAYMVEINGQQITFLDTPGHEAFTAMRMRGAQSTDIAILVVAADDGVMPQTVEAINHAKAADVEILVAINKIDKPSANVERVKQELSEYELIPEDWGGSTIFVPVSAHTKEGISDLLEMILLAAEVKELRANPNRKARGIVIEAELDKGKGPVATILVQKGTLHVGDNVTAGACYGKVRAMMDDKGRRVKEAGPSQPVEILGLNDVPGAGDVLMVTENEKEARGYAETFIAEGKNKLLEDTKSRLSLDDLFSQIKAGNVKELPIIIKADVQGSVEAVKESLVKLSNEEVMVKVIHGGVGAINESDVSLASASNAIIIGFNVRPDVTAKSIAEREKVDLRLYRVIYQAIEDVEAAMKGMLDPVFEEQVIGHAVVRQLFKASGVGTIAGSYVTDGKFQRGCSCRITRGGEMIFNGGLASLKRFKDDVKEVATGYECGLVFEKFNDLQEDDVIEAYIMVEVPR